MLSGDMYTEYTRGCQYIQERSPTASRQVPTLIVQRICAYIELHPVNDMPSLKRHQEEMVQRKFAALVIPLLTLMIPWDITVSNNRNRFSKRCRAQ
jgi:hypothetical protein